MKKYILDAYRQKKMEEKLKQSQKPKKMSEEVLNRLYKAPPPKEKSENETESANTKANERKKYDKEFVKRLLELHANERPTERRYADQDRLFSFWQGLTNKYEHKLNKNEESVKEDLELYFDDKYDSIEDVFYAKYGFRTYETKSLLNFYKNEISVRKMRYKKFNIKRRRTKRKKR